MGYRSEVTIIIPLEKEKEVLAKAVELQKGYYQPNSNLPTCEDVNKSYFEYADTRKIHKSSYECGVKEVVYTWDWEKWYETYPWIVAIEMALEWCEEQEISYSFCRLGEELEDVEIKNFYTDTNNVSKISLGAHY